MRKDPNEWKNLIGDESLASTIASHKRFLPSTNLKPVPGSKHRILLYDADTKQVNWEDDDIQPGALIPEVEQ